MFLHKPLCNLIFTWQQFCHVCTSEKIHCITLSAPLLYPSCNSNDRAVLQGADMETTSQVSYQWLETYADCIFQLVQSVIIRSDCAHSLSTSTLPCASRQPPNNVWRERESHPFLPSFIFYHTFSESWHQLGTKVLLLIASLPPHNCEP